MPGSGGELEWNIAKERIKKISQILSKLRDSYEAAKYNRSRDNVKVYYTHLYSLFQELYIYLPNTISEDGRWGSQKIGQELEKLQKVVNKKDNGQVWLSQFKTLEKIDRKLNQERKNLGLDIPTKQRPGKGEELLWGS